uniref:BTB domain-containing protein n=1 Tax=Romanomermis culicivorax TaxID=13658 RepID=A0A915JPI6_ROMCU
MFESRNVSVDNRNEHDITSHRCFALSSEDKIFYRCDIIDYYPELNGDKEHVSATPGNMAHDIEFSSMFFAPSEERSLCLLLDDPDQDPNQGRICNDLANEKLKLWVAKDLLAVASPVFKRMFYAGNFRESLSENSDQPIYLPGKNVNHFLEFLKCLFPSSNRKKVDKSNMRIILPLADEYQVEMLLRKCIKCFKRAIFQFGIDFIVSANARLNFCAQCSPRRCLAFHCHPFPSRFQVCIPKISRSACKI